MSEEILDRIERYSKGKMGLDEKLHFEKELAADESLREQLEFSQIVDQMIIGNEALKLKEQMRADLYQPKPRNGIYFAISLLLVVGSVGFYYFQSQKPEKQEVLVKENVVTKEIKKEQENVVEKPKVVAEKPKTVSVESKLPVLEKTIKTIEPTIVSENVQISPIQHQLSTSERNLISENKIIEFSKVNPCENFRGEVEFTTVASCKGEETGEVILNPESVKGGKAPYLFQMGEKKAKKRFEQMAAGEYSLSIKDANDCLVENSKKVVIAVKNCQKVMEYSFNPEYDHEWAIPYNHSKVPKHIKILDKGGRTIFESSVVASYPTTWNGESNTGNVLGVGLYLFAIEYADGSLEEGNLVVSR